LVKTQTKEKRYYSNSLSKIAGNSSINLVNQAIDFYQ
jgi:hypothetical protein